MSDRNAKLLKSSSLAPWVSAAKDRHIGLSAVCTTYILVAPEGLELGTSIAYPIGLIVPAVLAAVFLFKPAKGVATAPIVEGKGS